MCRKQRVISTATVKKETDSGKSSVTTVNVGVRGERYSWFIESVQTAGGRPRLSHRCRCLAGPGVGCGDGAAASSKSRFSR